MTDARSAVPVQIRTLNANEAVASLDYRASEVIATYRTRPTARWASTPTPALRAAQSARQRVPSFMRFELISQAQADIAPSLEEVKKLAHDAGTVLVSATPV